MLLAEDLEALDGARLAVFMLIQHNVPLLLYIYESLINHFIFAVMTLLSYNYFIDGFKTDL